MSAATTQQRTSSSKRFSFRSMRKGATKMATRVGSFFSSGSSTSSKSTDNSSEGKKKGSKTNKEEASTANKPRNKLAGDTHYPGHQDDSIFEELGKEPEMSKLFLQPKPLKKLDSSGSCESTVCGSSSDEMNASFHEPSIQTSSDPSTIPNATTIESEEIIYDIDPDFLLPKGSLEMTSHKIVLGEFGKVKIGLFRKKHKVIFKGYQNLSKHPEVKRSLYHELEILKTIGFHTNIHALFGYIWNDQENPDHPPLYMIYDLAPYGSLMKILERREVIPDIPMSLCIAWLNDITDAVAFLHRKGICHSGICAENILVYDRLDIKLCNFTTASNVGGDAMYNIPFLSDEMMMTKMKDFHLDFRGILHTTLQILTRKTSTTLVEEQTDAKYESMEVYVKEVFEALPITEYTIGLKIFHILSPILSLSPSSAKKAMGIKKLSVRAMLDEFTVLMDDLYEGDPRDKANDYSIPIKRVELMIMASTAKIHQLIQLTPRLSIQSQMMLKRLIQSMQEFQREAMNTMKQTEREDGEPFNEEDSNTSSLSSFEDLLLTGNPDYIPDEATITNRSEVVIDPRKFLTTWIEYECKATIAVAEELALLLVVNGILSPKHLHEKLKVNPYFLTSLPFDDEFGILPKLKNLLLAIQQ